MMLLGSAIPVHHILVVSAPSSENFPRTGLENSHDRTPATGPGHPLQLLPDWKQDGGSLNSVAL